MDTVRILSSVPWPSLSLEELELELEESDECLRLRYRRLSRL